MFRFIVAVAIVGVVGALGQRTSAQSLTFSVFERYLESLREQTLIPGISVLVSQNGHEVWSSGLGRADIEGSLRPTPDTPYLIGGLSQTLGATLLLKECIDESYAELNDPVSEWVPGFGQPGTTIAHLLAHVSPSGAFQYDLTRFSWLTPVIERCSDNPYSPLLHEEIFTQLAMRNSVPGTAIRTPTPLEHRQYDTTDLSRFAVVLSQMATPYSVDRGRHVKTELTPIRADASTGIVTTVRDLSRFDNALDPGYDLLERPTLDRAWTRVAPNLPAGLGWFVQTYNGERVVWQFGEVKNSYSALFVKVPNRRLTFILFANSDALAAPFLRGNVWDVTASAFAKLFLVMYVP